MYSYFCLAFLLIEFKDSFAIIYVLLENKSEMSLIPNLPKVPKFRLGEKKKYKVTRSYRAGSLILPYSPGIIPFSFVFLVAVVVWRGRSEIMFVAAIFVLILRAYFSPRKAPAKDVLTIWYREFCSRREKVEMRIGRRFTVRPRREEVLLYCTYGVCITAVIDDKKRYT